MKKIIRITESQLDSLIKSRILNEIRASKNAIQEDSILLRTMTEKSVLTFGQYKGQTIEEILRLGKRHYIRYLYYNVEGISFTEDILRKIGIITGQYDNRISKPGKDPELGRKIEDINAKNIPFKTKSDYRTILKAREVGNKYIVDRGQFSRGKLARKNQGHI
jgi:hypothetical protein